MHHENKVFHYLVFNKILTEFYFMISVRSFAVVMITIFLPIFVYTIRNSLFDLILFAFFTYLTMFIFSPFAAKMTSKVGNAHTMLCIGRFAVLGVFALLLMYPTIALFGAIFFSGCLGLLYLKV